MMIATSCDWTTLDAEATALDRDIDALCELMDGNEWRALSGSERAVLEQRYAALQRRFDDATERLLLTPASGAASFRIKLRWWGRLHGDLDAGLLVGAGPSDAAITWFGLLEDCAEMR